MADRDLIVYGPEGLSGNADGPTAAMFTRDRYPSRGAAKAAFCRALDLDPADAWTRLRVVARWVTAEARPATPDELLAGKAGPLGLIVTLREVDPAVEPALCSAIWRVEWRP